ncbi:MAG: hypothetical protein JO028_20305 [Acidobacteriaceae bacterium]|nr:hypothetical protein [Acidobacteriaceae bacterium]
MRAQQPVAPQGSQPDLSNVNDILDGQRMLLHIDDLVISGGILPNGYQQSPIYGEPWTRTAAQYRHGWRQAAAPGSRLQLQLETDAGRLDCSCAYLSAFMGYEDTKTGRSECFIRRGQASSHSSFRFG